MSQNITDDTMKFTEISDDPYEVEKCAKWIHTYGLEKVCLQFPDNHLLNSAEVALRLEKLANKKIYILGDTTCGSCCVDEIAAQHVNADGIIHYGHACLSPTIRLPVFHVFPKKRIDIKFLHKKLKEVLQDCTKRYILFYDVAYAYIIEQIYNEVKPIFKNLVISTLSCVSSIEFTNTKNYVSTAVLGRNYVLENGCKIEDYEALYLGENGKTLTILGLSIPAKKWYYIDNNEIILFEPSNTPWLKRRRYLVEKLKDAKIVGIVVATLGIKEYLESIKMIKNILKERNKKTYILSVGKINPTKLANFPEIDAFVIITCPENEVFDSRDFLKPILMPYEVDLAFNISREFSMQYCMDFRQILPGGLNHCDFTMSHDADVSLISGDIRNSEKDMLCTTDQMNVLVLSSPGTVAIGKAGAQYLQNRSWKGVEQRLGKDFAQPAKIGRSGLASRYENEHDT